MAIQFTHALNVSGSIKELNERSNFRLPGSNRHRHSVRHPSCLEGLMNTIILKRARAIWCNDLTPIATQRHNIRAWVRSVRQLGDKHLLATKITKKDES